MPINITEMYGRISEYLDILSSQLDDALTNCFWKDVNKAQHFISEARETIKFLQFNVDELEQEARFYERCFKENINTN